MFAWSGQGKDCRLFDHVAPVMTNTAGRDTRRKQYKKTEPVAAPIVSGPVSGLFCPVFYNPLQFAFRYHGKSNALQPVRRLIKSLTIFGQQLATRPAYYVPAVLRGYCFQA